MEEIKIIKRLKQFLKKENVLNKKNKILEQEQKKWGCTIGVNPPIKSPRPKHPGIK